MRGRHESLCPRRCLIATRLADTFSFVGSSPRPPQIRDAGSVTAPIPMPHYMQRELRRPRVFVCRAAELNPNAQLRPGLSPGDATPATWERQNTATQVDQMTR